MDDDMGAVHGVIVNDNEGVPVIGINEGLTMPEQIAAIVHEVAHLLRGDLDRWGDDTALIERECRRDVLRAAIHIIEECQGITPEA